MSSKTIDVIIEGTYHDAWSKFYYFPVKFAHVEEKVVSFYFDDSEFLLIGNIEDNTSIKFGWFPDGEHRNYNKKLSALMFHCERPRTVFFPDGRVFVEVSMIEQTYLKALEQSIVPHIIDYTQKFPYLPSQTGLTGVPPLHKKPNWMNRLYNILGVQASTKIPRREVVVGILQREDYYLLECRRESEQYFPEEVMFPGGSIEPDEQPSDAMIREMEEELGVTPTEFYLLGQFEYEESLAKSYVYVVEQWEGQPESKGEAKEVFWSHRGRDITRWPDRNWIRRIKARKVLTSLINTQQSQ